MASKKTTKAQKEGRRAHSGSVSPYGSAKARPRKKPKKKAKKKS